MKRIITGMLMAMFLTSMSLASTVQIKGSDTLINMVQQFVEDYKKVKPSTMIAVTGGGSGTGIAALINGRAEIANASREIKDKEIKKAEKKGFTPKHIAVALDGLSVIVNKNNPVKKLTLDQIGKIFKGEITNWKEVGGNDMPITTYGRQSSSGTFGFFRKKVLKGDYTPKMNRMNGNSSIVEAVQQDKSSIGYVGVAYVNDKPELILHVAVKAGGNYASPLDTKAVYSGDYPIVRPLYQYFNKLSPEAIEFMEYELGPIGQATVKAQGFYPIGGKIMSDSHKALDEAKK